MENRKYRMNLQFFADGDGGGEPEDGNGLDGNGGEGKDSFTKEEVLQLIQSESDKRVQQALKSQQKKYEKELVKQKSLAGLDEEGRVQAEKDQTIAELTGELEKLRLANTKAEIAKVLNNRGLDAGLVDFVVTTDDADECIVKIDALDKIFKTMVKKEVDSKLRAGGGTPKGSSLGLDGGITKEQFVKMSIAEQAELAKNNIELYTQLAKR